MGRPRKSLQELALKGTLKQHPGAYASRIAEELGTGQPAPETIPDPENALGEAPKSFHTGQKRAFEEIRADYPHLTKADRLQVEQASRLLSASRNPKKEFPARSEKLLASLLAALAKPRKAAKTVTPKASIPVNLLPASLRPATEEPLPHSDIPCEAWTGEQLMAFVMATQERVFGPVYRDGRKVWP